MLEDEEEGEEEGDEEDYHRHFHSQQQSIIKEEPNFEDRYLL